MVVLVGTLKMKVLVLDGLVLKHRHPWGVAYHETGSSELESSCFPTLHLTNINELEGEPLVTQVLASVLKTFTIALPSFRFNSQGFNYFHF